MPHLLHIESSPRKQRSASIEVANAFITAWKARHSEATIDTLDVWSTPLPAFDGEALGAKYAALEGVERSAEQRKVWADIEALGQRLHRADVIVVSVPMWNFGIPWQLKQYIDTITQPGMAFRVSETGVEGLGAGKRAILVASGALDIRPGAPGAELDHQVRFMQAWLGFIGITDVHVVHLRPTYGPPEVVEAAMTEAYASAEALVADLSRASRV